MRMIPAVLAAAAMVQAVPGAAAPWQVLGPRPLGMGGAFVAIAEDPAGAYWNPAGLGQVQNPNGVQLPVSARAEFTGNVLQGANDINQLIRDCNALAASCTTGRINGAVAAFNEPGNGALVDAAGGLNLKFGRLAVFADTFALIGGTPVVDLTRVTPANFSTNASRVRLTGIQFTEIGAGYGREVMETGLMLGGNLKGIIGHVGYHDLSLAIDDPEAVSGLRNYNRSVKTTFQPGLDLGLLWDARETFPDIWWRPRLGIVGRNINNPHFSQPGEATAAGQPVRHSLEGQARAGLALTPLGFWNISADIDLTDNLTPVEGFKSRFLSLGTEINVVHRPAFNLPLRAGVMKNVSAGSSGVSWTGGFGLNFLHVIVDLGVAISDRRTSLQAEGKAENVPHNLSAAAQFAVLFGGRDREGASRP